MTYRPTNYFLGGVLNNTEPGYVVGRLRFAGQAEPVRLALEGDFHGDLYGGALLLFGEPKARTRMAAGRRYLSGFSPVQTGSVEAVACLRPIGKRPYVHIEWYSEQNGRVVLGRRSEFALVIHSGVPTHGAAVDFEGEPSNELGKLVQRWFGPRLGRDDDETTESF